MKYKAKTFKDIMAKLGLKLTRPIIFFDLETTGVNVVKDRIVSIACTKLNPDGSEISKNAIINPEMPIPKEASDVNGFTDEMVAKFPVFAQRAKGLYEFFHGCDIGGFNNNHFDNPLLSEEFSRCGILFPEPNTKSVDIGVIFKKFEQRTLSAAMKFYYGIDNFEEMAHDAAEDTKATVQVFYAMLQKYDELKGKDIAFLSDFCKLKEGQLDFQGKLFRNENGIICFNFGNDAVKGKPVVDSMSFANWVLSKEDMPMTTKLWIRKALDEKQNGVIPNLFKDLPKNE